MHRFVLILLKIEFIETFYLKEIMKKKYNEEFGIIVLLLLLFGVGIILIHNTHNSFGGADNIAHYFAAHFGWEYPYLLFGHWNKPVFTILSSPFAQFGINGVRVYNLILGLSSAFLTYKTAKKIGLKSAFISIVLTLLAPIYFISMFSSLTEVTFSFFLILGVYLFFSERLHWSAFVISFIPMIRTEGIILLPLFAIAYGLRKSYLSIFLLITGFIIISLLGLPFHESIWWQITEMPYQGESVYGSGVWYHFIERTRGVGGYLNMLLFLVSFVIVFRKYIRTSILKFDKYFYFLLLIFVPFMLYFSAHSAVWALGIGKSLGLLRVIAAVIPLMALGSVFSFEKVYDYLKKKSKYLLYVVYLGITIFMFNEVYHIYKWGFYSSSREQTMQKTASFIVNSGLDANCLVYYDPTIVYELDRDPYNKDRNMWMINDRRNPSLRFSDNTIIVWDSHFGNNEGRMPLEYLLNDSNLILVSKIVPEVPFTVLGGWDYEINIFQKQRRESNSLMRHFYLDFNLENKIDNEDSTCFFVKPSQVYSPGLVANTSSITHKPMQFQIDVHFDFKNMKAEEIENISLILAVEGGENYGYYPRSFVSKINRSNQWARIECIFNDISLKPGVEVLKVYIWNSKKSSFLLDNFTVDFYPISEDTN